MSFFSTLYEKTGLLNKVGQLAAEQEVGSSRFAKLHHIESFMRVQLHRESQGLSLGPAGELLFGLDVLCDLANVNRFKDLANRCVDVDTQPHIIEGMSVSVYMPVLSYAIKNRHPVMIDSKYFDDYLTQEQIGQLCMLHDAPMPLLIDVTEFDDAQLYQKAVDCVAQGNVLVVTNRENVQKPGMGYSKFIPNVVMYYSMRGGHRGLYLFADCFTCISYRWLGHLLTWQKNLSGAVFLQNTHHHSDYYQQLGRYQDRDEFDRMVAPYQWQPPVGLKGQVMRFI